MNAKIFPHMHLAVAFAPGDQVATEKVSALGRSLRLSRQLEAGMVILNSVPVGTVSIPFGGIKQSGYGREGSYYGIEEYVHVKYVLMAGAQL
jgi:succinate-semialdehyde dehydrogenase/glutarate-semialdehyde dehydrogenase